MIRRAAVSTTIVLALAACSSGTSEGSPQSDATDSASAAKTAAVEEDALPPPPTAPGTAYLVWSADSAGQGPWHADSARVETAWIDDGGKVIATRPEVVIAAGGALWAWRQGKGRGAGYDCQCSEDHNNEVADACLTTEPVSVVSLAELGGGGRRSLLPVPNGGEPAPGHLATAPPMQGMTPVGSVGPYLFTESWLWSYTCGANHGASFMARTVWDLRDGSGDVDLVTGDTLRVLAPQAARARAALIVEGQVFQPIEHFELTALEPLWRADGRLEMGYRFAADACWACGDGHSAGYSRSTLVTGPVPAPLAPWASAPAPVRRYWAAHPPRTHAGWSEVPPAEAPRVLERFRAR
jgi:hypothetical protein